MVTLKEAINLFDLKDDDIIYLVKRRHETFVEPLTIRKIREKYDMKRTMVLKIYPFHFRYSDSQDYELIIKEDGRRDRA